ncbi:MAG: PEP-CTERM sorting domain-containing protein [Akkermansiaceae bacterium]|nr:PEP-CTERM sorting domain-containing protein [Akkermansiaceae bacterium]
MKKTLIALMAMAGVAAAAVPTTYEATFASNGEAALTWSDGQNASNILFGTGATTLDSWMIEFQISDLQDPGTFMCTAPTTAGFVGANDRDGLGIRTSTTTGMRIAVNGNNGSQSDGLLSITNVNNLSATNPLTLRFAYDAKSNTAYLFNVGTGKSISMSTGTTDYTLKSVASSTAAAATTATFYSDGATSYKLVDVTDMSTLAGKTSFVTYLTTKTIPEPTTATLSLLALAGLAARRRRR